MSITLYFEFSINYSMKWFGTVVNFSMCKCIVSPIFRSQDWVQIFDLNDITYGSPLTIKSILLIYFFIMYKSSLCFFISNGMMVNMMLFSWKFIWWFKTYADHWFRNIRQIKRKAQSGCAEKAYVWLEQSLMHLSWCWVDFAEVHSKWLRIRWGMS